MAPNPALLEALKPFSSSLGGLNAPIRGCAISKSGDTLVSGVRTTVMVWCRGGRRSQPTLLRFIGHKGNVTAVDIHSYSSTEQLAASVADDGKLRLWTPTPRGGSTEYELHHSSRINHVKFSSSGDMLVTCANDCSVKLWRVTPPSSRTKNAVTLIRTFTGHTNWVRCACFAGDDLLYSVGDDGIIKVWNIKTGDAKPHREFGRGYIKDVCHEICLSEDGNYLAAAVGSVVQVWDTRTTSIRWAFDAKDKVRSIAWHPSGEFIVAGVDDRTVKLYNVAEGRLEFTLRGHTDKVGNVTMGDAGENIVSADDGGQLCIWSFGAPSDARASKKRGARDVGKTRGVEGTSSARAPSLDASPVAPLIVEAEEGDSMPTELIGAMQAVLEQMKDVQRTVAALDKRLSAIEDRCSK